MKSIHILKTLFLGLIILLSSPALGQEKINIAAGLGIPELVNLGLRFQFGQSQLGFYGGILPRTDEKAYSLGADYYYHFGGSSEFSTRRPWFAKAGINYFQDEDTYVKNTYLFLVPRIGRDINLTGKIGITVEGGLLLLLDHNEVEIKPREGCWFLCDDWLTPDILPSLGVSVFYRL